MCIYIYIYGGVALETVVPLSAGMDFQLLAFFAGTGRLGNLGPRCAQIGLKLSPFFPAAPSPYKGAKHLKMNTRG